MNESSMINYMKRAIELARDRSHPNIRKPLVGVLVVNHGEIVGRGRQEFIPGTRLIQHAERVALNQAGEYARGATLVTTLEPCSPNKKSRKAILKSCSELIVESGIVKVIYGDLDETFQGRSIEFLKDRGVAVYRCPANFTDLGVSYYSNRKKQLELNKKITI